MSINLRIKEIIETLYSGNKRAFSTAVGIAATVTENIVGRRQSYPSYEVTSKILSSIENISAEWLLTGKGTMFKTKEALPEEVTGIKDVVADGQTGYGKADRPLINKILPIENSFSEAIGSKEYKAFSIPFINDYDFLLYNYGDSMINDTEQNKSIKDRDILACKLWKNHSYIRWGEVYALATRDGYIIKKIMPSDTENKIKCISFNEQKGYRAYDLPVSEILDWAIVVGVISINTW